MSTDLSTIDANFVHFETSETPMHIASVQVLELQPGQTVASYLAELRRVIYSRRHEVPYMLRVLDTTTLQWETARDIDIEHHVRMCWVDEPGDRAAMDRALAQQHETPLDKNRPLWDIVVLAGLEGGRVALYNRVHHACTDGAAGQLAIERMSDPTPEPRDAVVPAEPAPSKTTPIEQWIEKGTHLFADQIASLHEMPWHMNAWMRVMQLLANPLAGATHFNAPTPQTPLNRAVGSKRTYATGEMPLAQVKAFAKANKASLNEVFLALCGGALRRYLHRGGQLPSQTLQASVPIALRSPGSSTFDNQVSAMRVALGTDIECIHERLGFVREASHFAKTVAAEMLPLNARSRAYATAGLQRFMAEQMRGSVALGMTPQPLANVVISNVPGPRECRYFAGGRMLTHYPVSVAAHGLGVNITVQSYEGELFFGITACARALPDPEHLAADLMAEWQALAGDVNDPTDNLPAEPMKQVA